MSPEDALQMQIERYRAMTPEQRLGVGLELHDLICQVMRSGIQQQFPDWDELQQEAEFNRRMTLAQR